MSEPIDKCISLISDEIKDFSDNVQEKIIEELNHTADEILDYIKSNAPVRVPFPSQKKIMVERKKSGLSGLLGGKEMVEETIDIRYEEDL